MIARAKDFPDHNDDDGSVPNPTPAEIRVRAREVRMKWSERTRKRRRVGTDPSWSVPRIALDIGEEPVVEQN